MNRLGRDRVKGNLLGVSKYALSAVFLPSGSFVVLLLLGEVLLDLLDIRFALRWRREDGGDLERYELRVGGLALCLERLKDLEKLDGVVNRGGREQRVEAPASGGGIVLVEDGLGDRLLGESLAWPEGSGILGLEEIDMEAKDVPILDRVGDG